MYCFANIGSVCAYRRGLSLTTYIQEVCIWYWAPYFLKIAPNRLTCAGASSRRPGHCPNSRAGMVIPAPAHDSERILYHTQCAVNAVPIELSRRSSRSAYTAPMPSRALTIILNFDHSRKFALLLPEETDSLGTLNLKERILREGRNKFRIKNLSSIYLQGGTLLGDENADLLSAAKVWVGKGEPYAGPPKPIQNAMPGTIRIIA